jgi:hypothetical protein
MAQQPHEVETMPEFTKALFLQALEEWGRYRAAFARLPTAEQAVFLKEQGYASARDLLAHVAVWWEEAEGIIDAAVTQKPRPARQYNFDEFNAAAVGRFKETSETEFMAWYESQRKQMVAVVSALSDEQLKIRRVYSWLDGVRWSISRRLWTRRVSDNRYAAAGWATTWRFRLLTGISRRFLKQGLCVFKIWRRMSSPGGSTASVPPSPP